VIRLHDTATGQVRELELRDPGKVSMYVCGPTVYDLPHLGHGRFVLVFDVLRRYFGWSGLEVTYVSNITDVDDYIIRRADREGRTEGEVAAEFEDVWWDALDQLHVERPTADPHATAWIPQMVEMVESLVARGFAYETSDGVYLEAERVEGYGLLARQPLESLRAGARVESTDEKRSPVDFAVWKKAKEGEPSWPSPWGAGRPGWHTECVVMSLGLLGDGFDIHGGGQDLAFPHHENERAQAVALGRPFARHWVHNGWVVVEGEKMSKSLGNFTTLVDLLERTDQRAYRLLVLQAHYRSPIEVTPSTVERAVSTLAGLDAFARSTRDLATVPADAELLERFREAMDDDLDTPKAMSSVFTAVRDANTLIAGGDIASAAPMAAAITEICTVLGLELDDGTRIDIDADTEALVLRRDAARAARDYAAADAARDELVGRGWIVEDTPAGTRIHPR
jgi:cysteinyl-tRNA synthetase